MAIFVTFSFAFLPLLSQQAMAAHHVMDGIGSTLVATSLDQTKHQNVDGSCEQKSGTQSSEEQMNCCDMNCTSFAEFETADAPAFGLTVSEHFQIDAEQLTSRIAFELMRPPRA